jgi:hypothetical protein
MANPTTDLVNRLREMAQCDVGECTPHAEIELEAADEIDRLNTEIQNLKKAALDDMTDWAREMHGG